MKKAGHSKSTPSITTQAGYQQVMARIDGLMDKGSGQLTRVEISELRRLAF